MRCKMQNDCVIQSSTVHIDDSRVLHRTVLYCKIHLFFDTNEVVSLLIFVLTFHKFILEKV